MHKLLIIFIIIFTSCKLTAANGDTFHDEVLFYNVENLFDTEVDSTRAYNEFSPQSKKKWNKYRLNKKINELAKCLAATDENGPEFIGLAEIENELILKKLTSQPLLYQHHYEILHFESKDVRGIDVAFLYKPSVFDLISYKKIIIKKKRRPTRDIILVMGIHKPSKDTLAFYVNHWPSRYGGAKKSEKSRVQAAITLQNQMDSIQKKHPHCKQITMGDFNDSPQDSSMSKVLDNKEYVNLFRDSIFKYGSLKYKSRWQVFDQFIVSKNLIKADKLKLNSVQIFSPEWLLEKDKKYGGKKPFRTYLGPRYHGGISDHLPVILKLEY